MSTNSQFAVIVHTLTLLACQQSPVSSAWIAGSVNTNPVVIRQVIGQLREAGLVETIPGSAGGAVLKKNAAEITLKEVYQLVKGDTFFGLHPNKPNSHCPVGRNIQDVLVGICDQMDCLIGGALAGISILDVVRQVSCREAERTRENQV